MEGFKIKFKKNIFQLGINPFDVESIFYFSKRTNVCPQGKMSLLLRTPDAVSHPVLLTKIKS